mgnify:CR=1 FL=1
MHKKLHNKKHLYRKILICIIQIILSNNVFCQNIETIIKSKPITISGNVNFNTNADFLEDSLNSYYYLSGGLNTTIFGIVSIPISFAYSDNTLTKNLSLPFNRFSLSPNYKEYTLYLGYNSMNFSKYNIKLISSIEEKASDDTADMPTIIIVIGDTIPASTAACPRTSAPTIEIELPPLPGNLISLSLNISHTINIINASIVAGKGTPCL